MTTLNFLRASVACLLMIVGSMSLIAQDAATTPASGGGYVATPPDMWEVGIHAGPMLGFTDIQYTPSIGGGFHVRRALDYVFSLRFDGLYGTYQGSDNDGSHTTNYMSGTLQLLMSVNNLKWNGVSNRRSNLYIYFGAGSNFFKVSNVTGQAITVDYRPVYHIEAGAGASVRITDRFNIGADLKSTVFVGAGARGDLLDGYRDAEDYDIPIYGSIRMNFNIGNKEKKAEPLYWVNPLDVVLNDISELKERPKFDLADSDGDGVLDIVDEEPNTPPNVPVDTKGRTLDSDGDGIADYMDQEPFSPPGYNVDQNGVAQVPDYVTRDEVKQLVADEVSKNFTDARGRKSRALANWFLPMVHFDIDSYKVREEDYEALAAVAQVMRANPDLRIVVTGYADKTGSEVYNNILSYRRAKAVVDVLVNQFGIPRERLILRYGGENNALVPATGSSFMNRRVEFTVATDETEMAMPNVGGKGRFSGSRDSGY